MPITIVEQDFSPIDLANDFGLTQIIRFQKFIEKKEKKIPKLWQIQSQLLAAM